ncbi:unnamed protein product [Toxocara canis]|uniref:Endo/exonuclease/phosphatase domain-containing protein n=1 Tax=Toxocara canis TaxID=6265 RepID=A0A183UR06_TOXCA|nr:unnamed protein product [Toxocara canis]
MISADILCLQEVQEEHFYNFCVPVLAKAGYKGQFKKRTRDMVDGCAIFYKPPMTLVSYQPIEYFVGEDTVLNRDNIGQLARFKEMFTGRELCIANTHLLFNKKRGDVKLAQLALLLAHLDKECGPNSARPCPYVLCGDFNMEPRCPIYEFLMNGRLSFENLRSGHLSGSGENGGRLLRTNLMPPQTMIGTNCRFGFRKNGVVSSYSKANEWTHSLQFASAYTHTSVDYWPEVSAFSSDGAFNPDFLFYSISSRNPLPPGDANGAVNLVEGPLRLIRRLALPSELMLRTTLGPWPNQVTPSDHIPLIADFILQ